MAWRGESWAEIVARASSTAPRKLGALTERASPEELAARAQPWTFTRAEIAIDGEGLVLGVSMESVTIAFAQLYHVEPVDPWPCLAIGWVDRGDAYSTVLAPYDADAVAFAATVMSVVTACAERVPRALVQGWLEIAEQPWERTDALPGEQVAAPEMGGYRVAPAVADPIVATRTIALGGPRLLTWLATRLLRPPRRVEPRRIVLTQRYVYVRTREGLALRLPADALRAMRRTATGDAIYVFGRNTELFLAHEPGCELAAQLDARVP